MGCLSSGRTVKSGLGKGKINLQDVYGMPAKICGRKIKIKDGWVVGKWQFSTIYGCDSLSFIIIYCA